MVRGLFRDGTASTNGGVKWTTFESTFFMKLRDAFASEPDARLDPCALARAVGSADVRQRIRAAGPRAAHAVGLISSRPCREGGRILEPPIAWSRSGRSGFYGRRSSSESRHRWLAAREETPEDGVRREAELGEEVGVARDPHHPVQTVRVRRGPGRSVEKNVRAAAAVAAAVRGASFARSGAGAAVRAGTASRGARASRARVTRARVPLPPGASATRTSASAARTPPSCFAHARRDGWPFEADLCMPVPDPPPAPMAASRARARSRTSRAGTCACCCRSGSTCSWACPRWRAGARF